MKNEQSQRLTPRSGRSHRLGLIGKIVRPAHRGRDSAEGVASAGTAQPQVAVAGEGTFVFPRSECRSAQHWYQHATMLLDGLWVMPDRRTGMQLLERAASAGYQHAINRLRAMQQNQRVNPGEGSGAS